MDAEELKREIRHELEVHSSENMRVTVLFSEMDEERDLVNGAWRFEWIDEAGEPEDFAADLIASFRREDDGFGYPPDYSARINRQVTSWGASGEAWELLLWLGEEATRTAAQEVFRRLLLRYRGSKDEVRRPIDLDEDEVRRAMMKAAWFVESSLVDVPRVVEFEGSPLENMEHVGTAIEASSIVFTFQRGDRRIEVEMVDPGGWKTIARWAWIEV